MTISISARGDQRQRVVGDAGRAVLARRRRASARRMRSAAQPMRASDARARSGARSATPTTWMPGVCLRLRQVHRAELAGADQRDAQRLPAAARSSSMRWRFIAHHAATRAPYNRRRRTPAIEEADSSMKLYYAPGACSLAVAHRARWRRACRTKRSRVDLATKRNRRRRRLPGDQREGLRCRRWCSTTAAC